MKILLTGGTGFIGSNTAHKLISSKYEVKYFQGDVIKVEDWVRNMKDYSDTILHIAGVRTETERDFEVNTTSAHSLSKALMKTIKKPKTIIYISTQAVYFGHQTPFLENMKVNPQTPYGKSKFLAEKTIIGISNKYNIRSIVLRPSTVLGKGVREGNRMSGPLYIWTQNAILNKKIEVFQDGLQTRDYIHIDDVTSAILLLAKNKKMQGIFNVGGGSKITLLEFATWIKNTTGSKSNIIVKGGDATTNDPRNLFSDTTKIQQFGWSPQKTAREAVYDFVTSII